MYYGDTTTDKLQRRYRKFYSEDGSTEIVNDTQAGSTSFVFYIGGDAYSAPAIWKEEHTSSAVAQNLYYLHRDHLGSILMITDVNGNIAEKRQFDAWGNIVKLTDGNGNVLTAFVILDRGYTGHEHLFGVALINMNARLYDPALHRFLSPDNFVQDPFNSQSYNRYGYAMNNPVIYSDPTGEFIPLLIFAAAAFIGGGGNVWSHWGEIVKHPWSAVGYFASGAVGGAVAVVNPWAGGSIAAVGNVATDVAFGNLPKFNGIGSVAKYIGGIALDGVGAAGAGSLSKWGFNAASQFGWVENVTLNGTSQIVSSGINTFSALAPEVSVTATKVPIASLLETAVGQAGRMAAKEGGTKLLNQFNSIESLLQGAGKLEPIKGGLQGFVKGDGSSIFKALTQNATEQANGTYLLKNGTTLFNHFSTKTGVYTIDINKIGSVFKLRIGP